MTKTPSDNLDIWAVSTAHALYSVTAKYMPNTATLGELRVLTVISLAAVTGTTVTTKEIFEQTDIAPYNISRIVSRYLEQGVLVEKPHPSDGRSKQICFNDLAFTIHKEWSRAMQQAISKAGLLQEGGPTK